MLTEELIRQRLKQVGEALAEIERQRTILLEARHSDERLLDLCLRKGASPEVAPTVTVSVAPDKPTTKGEAAVSVVRSAAGKMVDTDRIIYALRDSGYPTNPAIPIERRNTAWLLRDQITRKGLPIRNPMAHRWVWDESESADDPTANVVSQPMPNGATK